MPRISRSLIRAQYSAGILRTSSLTGIRYTVSDTRHVEELFVLQLLFYFMLIKIEFDFFYWMYQRLFSVIVILYIYKVKATFLVNLLSLWHWVHLDFLSHSSTIISRWMLFFLHLLPHTRVPCRVRFSLHLIIQRYSMKWTKHFFFFFLQPHQTNKQTKYPKAKWKAMESLKSTLFIITFPVSLSDYEMCCVQSIAPV